MEQTFYVVNYEDEYGEEYVDLLKIKFDTKTYVIYKDVPSFQLGGEDENGEEIYETFIEKTVFEILIEGLKQKGYTEEK